MAVRPSGFADAEHGERQGDLDEDDQGDQGFEGHGSRSLGAFAKVETGFAPKGTNNDVRLLRRSSPRAAG
jgi:hypothetical protein